MCCHVNHTYVLSNGEKIVKVRLCLFCPAVCLPTAWRKLKSDAIKWTKALPVTFEPLELTKSILIN